LYSFKGKIDGLHEYSKKNKDSKGISIENSFDTEDICENKQDTNDLTESSNFIRLPYFHALPIRGHLILIQFKSLKIILRMNRVLRAIRKKRKAVSLEKRRC
jgi:hypothetical protein